MWRLLNGQAFCLGVEERHDHCHNQDHARKEDEDAPLENTKHGQIRLRTHKQYPLSALVGAFLAPPICEKLDPIHSRFVTS